MKKIVLVLALVVPLLSVNPAPANANLISDLTTDATVVAGWLAQAAQYIKEAAQWLQVNAANFAQQLTQYLNGQLNTVLTQATVDGQMRAQMAHGNGVANEKFTPGTMSTACAITRARQESSQATAATLGMLTGFERYGVGPGAGLKGNTNASKFFTVDWNDLCQLGFINTNTLTNRYGNASNGCTDLSQNYPQYIDADTKLSSVIDKKQYPMPAPAHWQRTRDGHVSFFVSQGNSATPQEVAPGLGSEMDFAAAWKFCEHLQPQITSPTTNSGSFTAADAASIVADRQALAARTGGASECFRAIAYRTSCGSNQQANSNLNNAAQAQGGTQAPIPNCYQAQQKLCQRLTAPLVQGGLGLTLANADPVFSSALKNCATAGLSQAMYEAIMANICTDDNYTNTILPSTMDSAADVEKTIGFDCDTLTQNYNAKMDQERARLNAAVQALASRQIPNAGQNGQVLAP